LNQNQSRAMDEKNVAQPSKIFGFSSLEIFRLFLKIFKFKQALIFIIINLNVRPFKSRVANCASSYLKLIKDLEE